MFAVYSSVADAASNSPTEPLYNPHAWNTIKTFWALYFREAGADLVTYSPECLIERE